ncbi:hypothetical protein CEUSTIGMA_g11976.t1 [Chlamydomonas eustigma]|uniref:Alpha-1,3-glucosyltransferase n=1 Tax=Chlamydomonas eustigma TaxID=1157962 RepID=A0A250XN91_9CHLO|nr:hypothetical protein CEUSTIGMA_g11976.t1 [Chlamydomonas eustigma]|eukprot:GAX84555.1 hypothetical protein CEUSTIGMA_g11976.t1 [Chlamydomonas eustigma]
MISALSEHDKRWAITLAAILLRSIVGFSDYSGFATPPKYGDYEAQRHWMELTINLSPTSWYVNNGSINNASYWPLDYPPLSGYQSWLHGQFVQHVLPCSLGMLCCVQ